MEEELLTLRSEPLLPNFVGDDRTELFRNERSRRSSGLTAKSMSSSSSSSSSSDDTVVASTDGETGGPDVSAMLPSKSFDDLRLNFSRLLLVDDEGRIFTRSIPVTTFRFCVATKNTAAFGMKTDIQSTHTMQTVEWKETWSACSEIARKK
jgi:hypothetical protein